jgi:multisubunit Na+/H+ antiporter MnhB subunit
LRTYFSLQLCVKKIRVMKNISAKYIGLITGGIMVLVSLLMFYQFHLPDTGTVKYVCYSIYTIGIIISLLNFKNNTVNKDFKDYFSEGFKTFVVVCLIMALFTWIFYKMNPQIFDKIIEEINKINAQDPNKTTQEVIENGEKIRSIRIPMTVAINTIMYMVIGALVTLIGAGFLSQKK